MPEPSRRLLFGAAYYHEYQSTDRLDRDLDLMLAADVNVIRVGESVWSTWEPDNGFFDLDWLEPVLDGAKARDISVILGTPTYAVPPWLVRLYPEIAGERQSGQPIPWGARQEVDYTHPAFRFHAERIIRQVVARYVDHPSVIGIQVDNEPGPELLHNHGVFQRFVDHLRRTYGTVERLNEEWGLVYWSHRLSTWADLWRPDGNAQPQYELAWRRFQAQQINEFIGWQADIVREYASTEQFITTCIAYDRPGVEDQQLASRLDVTAGNAYYVMQDGLAMPDKRQQLQDWRTDGTWALYLSADRMYSSRQEPFLVTETNAGSIGMTWDNRPAYDGQWRQAAWALISRGAAMIEYWHWHTLPFGTETYWGGVLPHSGEPGRAYAEVSRLGRELKAGGALVTGLIPDADVAMLFSMPSRWLMQKFPALCHPDASPDDRAYQGLFEPFYRGAFEAALQTRILHADQLSLRDGEALSPAAMAESCAVLVAAGLYIADQQTLDWLRLYALAGGHLVLGPRSGYADHEARARTVAMPAGLHDLAGVSYDEFSNLLTPIDVAAADDSPLHLPPGAAGTRWVDGLQMDGATALASYLHPHFGRWPTVTTREAGKGRITYVGTVPNGALAGEVLRWAAAGRSSAWVDLPDQVTSTGASSRDGRRLRFVHNWNWNPIAVASPGRFTDVLTGEELVPGQKIALGPWDVRVLLERSHAMLASQA